jgi:hypothetical protein
VYVPQSALSTVTWNVPNAGPTGPKIWIRELAKVKEARALEEEV